MGYLYLYGMVMTSKSIRLRWDYPAADGYGEMEEEHYGVGGETGTAAVILSSLGCRLKLGGSHLGSKNNELIRAYFDKTQTDCSELVYDEQFAGVEDMVLIDKTTRTCFGRFAQLFSKGLDWVEKPSEESVKNADVVGCDPFFGEEIAHLCVKHNKPYAVIDCDYDSYLHQHCAVNAISHQHLKDKYKGQRVEDLFRLYTENTDGLVIITQGEGEVLYGRRGQEAKRFPAFAVDVQSTLGAGDSFKAGTIYGLAHGFEDDKLVQFATAVAAYSCAHYPIFEHPATLAGVQEIITSANQV